MILTDVRSKQYFKDQPDFQEHLRQSENTRTFDFIHAGCLLLGFYIIYIIVYSLS